MSTLTLEPVASLLERLFAQDEASDPASALGDISGEELARLRQSKTDYLEFYGRLREAPLAVSRETGALLYMLARAGQARRIVEFGASFGLSTLHLAAALRDNGGGRIVTTEFEPSKVARARANFAAAGLADLVEIREGDALETLKSGLPDEIDLAVLDGAKGLYPEVLALLEPRLRSGALVIADDADASPAYLARVRSHGYVSTPFGGDVEVSMRL